MLNNQYRPPGKNCQFHTNTGIVINERNTNKIKEASYDLIFLNCLKNNHWVKQQELCMYKVSSETCSTEAHVQRRIER